MFNKKNAHKLVSCRPSEENAEECILQQQSKNGP